MTLFLPMDELEREALAICECRAREHNATPREDSERLTAINDEAVRAWHEAGLDGFTIDLNGKFAYTGILWK